ncbi:BF2992 family fimbrillin-A clan protein [Bacteroides sp.]
MNKQLKSIFSPPPYGGGGWGVRLLLLLFLASCTEAEGLMERSRETVNFSLPTGGLASESAATRADGGGVNMTAGTTVRVLAYRRPNGATDAVLSNANYAGEATYKVTLGSVLELCSVTLDANGTPSVNAGGTPVPLELIAGDYDFYAITPALRVDHSGSAPTLQVRHHTDYAVSVTSKPISPGNSTVGLTTLQRQCTLLSFGIDRKEGVTSITSAAIDEISLSAMADEPMNAIAANPLDVSANANTGTVTLKQFNVPDPTTKPYHSTGQVICLPKSEAVFGLKMKVRFNGATDATELEANALPTMAFVKGLQYNLSVRFKERGAELVLTILPWTANSWSTSLGDDFLLQIVIGEWTELTLDTSMGSSVPMIKAVSGWTNLVSSIDIGPIYPLPDGITDWHPNDTDFGIGGGVDTPGDVPGWSGGNSNGGNMGGEAGSDQGVTDWTGNDSSTDLGTSRQGDELTR